MNRNLLSLVADDRDGAEKFSDARLAQAQSILDRAGPKGCCAGRC
tara:strand:- start:139 stop:273 length:135 start_codon:yes stop_codon:yes gene_type:complete